MSEIKYLKKYNIAKYKDVILYNTKIQNCTILHNTKHKLAQRSCLWSFIKNVELSFIFQLHLPQFYLRNGYVKNYSTVLKRRFIKNDWNQLLPSKGLGVEALLL